MDNQKNKMGMTWGRFAAMIGVFDISHVLSDVSAHLLARPRHVQH